MKYLVEMTVTERTRQRVMVEADSAEEAERLVEEYEIENDTFEQFDSLEWSISDVSAREGE